jgi:hypothetical protein
LIALRAKVEALLPEVEIADLPLEVHGWTGFLDEYTHMAGTPSREPGLPETLPALLVSESCNVGLTPVADPAYPPLTRDRLNWVAHNYLRSATHAAANTRLVDHHTRLPLAQAWGGGEMATADGMRFVIPVSTIHAAYNPRYFGRQRGSTLYSWMADTHTVFAQTLIPGTQRDSLYALDGLLANQTLIRPEMVSTDTAGASEIVFALAWTLGAVHTGGHPGWPTCPTSGSGTSTPTPAAVRSPGSPATASTPGSSPATGTRSAGSPARCGPVPSPPRRSCGPCNAARTPPAWPAPRRLSAGRIHAEHDERDDGVVGAPVEPAVHGAVLDVAVTWVEVHGAAFELHRQHAADHEAEIDGVGAVKAAPAARRFVRPDGKEPEPYAAGRWEQAGGTRTGRRGHDGIGGPQRVQHPTGGKFSDVHELVGGHGRAALGVQPRLDETNLPHRTTATSSASRASWQLAGELERSSPTSSSTVSFQSSGRS